MLLAAAIRLIAYTAGASLHAFLAALLLRKRGRSRLENLALAALCAGGAWHLANAMSLFYVANFGEENRLLPGLLGWVSAAGLALIPSLLLHLALAWAGVVFWMAAPVYLAVGPMGWLLATGRTQVFEFWTGFALAAAAGLCWRAARQRPEAHEGRFLRVFAASLLIVLVAGAATGAGSPVVVLAGLAPPMAFAYFVYGYQLFRLLISQRIVFAFALGLTCAFYLFAVRRVAGFVEDEFEALGPLTELALIFAAALIWLPLYGWMTRFLTKRTQLYADFSKRLIEEAARILDLEERLRFLAGEVRLTFRLRRVLLLATGEKTFRGESGAPSTEEESGTLEGILELVRARRVEMVRLHNTPDPELCGLLAKTGFTYLLPLWYEDRLSGLLLLDTSPRISLDENEPILLGLSRQISHSFETYRAIEEKIRLEKALVRQEHLASLGKVAAAIAHEVKNPLSSIRTLAQLMQEDSQTNSRYGRDLAYMISEADRLNRSVQQLLSFSRPLPEPVEEVNVTELLETMAQVLERQYAGASVQVGHSVAPGLIVKRSSGELIRQIVLNLVLNAIQASEPGGRVCLEVAEAPEGKISISVTDQGAGVPEAIRDKIFEPFFTTKQRGTGLGLAIVRDNVRHLGGEIRLESPVNGGQGTRAVVVLPAK